MILRPYQTEAADAVHNALRDNRSALVVMATGLGKTVLFADVIRQWRGTAIVLAHRKELIEQAHGKLLDAGCNAQIEMAGQRVDFAYAPRRPVIVSSVQTLCKVDRQQKLQSRMRRHGFDPPSLLVTDEAHHATADTYRMVYAWLESMNDQWRHLGVTATPNRADGEALGQIYESVAYEYGIRPAIDDGWLVPIHPHAVSVENLDFSSVKSNAKGDLNEAELEQILTEEQHLHDVALPLVDLCGTKSTLVFCVTVKHAELLARVIERYYKSRGLNGSAVHLDGRTHKDERSRTIGAYKRGEITALCNCGLFLEGFDAPNTECVVMARPTKSLALYTQVVGRGTRPLPGVVDGWDTVEQRVAAIAASKKPEMILLDFVGNSGRHRLISSADVLGGDYRLEHIDYAAALIADADESITDTREALERAAIDLALLEEERERKAEEEEIWNALMDEEAKRKSVVAARASYTAKSVDPFGPGSDYDAPNQPKRNGVPATRKQIGYLMHLSREAGKGWKWADLEKLSKKQAGALISQTKAELQEAMA